MKKLNVILIINFMILLPLASANAQASCTSGCSYGDCHVVVEQSAEQWLLNINCGDGGTVWEGEGTYSGTICGGFSPCQI
ncbi:MAG: hypothetical protein FH748_13830 [Balneolaceae bacterium]|nr:hypothetical protein [Balneolaceae bacterium]